jgi:hypothetical protein
LSTPNPFDLQHGLRNLSNLSIRHFLGQNLCKSAFNFVFTEVFGFAETEELPIATTDDGQEFVLLSVTRFRDSGFGLGCTGKRMSRFSNAGKNGPAS